MAYMRGHSNRTTTPNQYGPHGEVLQAELLRAAAGQQKHSRKHSAVSPRAASALEYNAHLLNNSVNMHRQPHPAALGPTRPKATSKSMTTEVKIKFRRKAHKS